MGTVERGESNLSFQNIAKLATALGLPLSSLFLGLEGKAQASEDEPPKTPALKPKKRSTAAKNNR